MDQRYTDEYLVERVADAIWLDTQFPGSGFTAAFKHLLDEHPRKDSIYSQGFEEYVRRNAPPPTRPWWKRIWSMPSPDNRPGGPWR